MSLEFFQINDVILDVLPSDIIQFTNNAVYEESFIRSKATFAFRSKYSSSKIIVTLPISMNPLAYKNPDEYSSQHKGLKVLHELSNYPFCFVKSNRIKSYLSSRANFSSTGFMMFAVDEINLIQDMSVPNMLFMEFHLIYNDHTSQVPDFKFVSSDGNYEVDSPDESLLFTQTFEMGFEDKYNSFIQSVLDFKNKVDEEQNDKAYGASSTPYNLVEALVPQVIEETESEMSSFKEKFDEIKKKFEYKTVKVTAKNGNDSVSADFLAGYTGQDNTGDAIADEDSNQNQVADALQTLYVYWTTFQTLSFGGPSSVQSIKMSLKNKLAMLNVGTHKYPIVQHLGRFPAKLSIVLNFNNGLIYETEDSSIISCVGQLTNVLDYNNDMFPEIGAYNNLKIRSVLSQLVGIENFVPDQSNIRSSAEINGQEIVTLSFTEAEVEGFLNAGKVTRGRPSPYDGDAGIELKTVISFINAVMNDSNFRSQMEKSKDVSLYAQVVQSLVEATSLGQTSFYGNTDQKSLLTQADSINSDVTKKISSDIRNDTTLTKINDVANKSYFSSYNYPSSESTISGDESNIQSLSKVGHIAHSITVYNTYEPEYFETIHLFLQRYKEGIEYTEAHQDDINNKTYGNTNSLFKKNGAVTDRILTAFQLLVSLKERGDSYVAKILDNEKAVVSGTREYLIERLRNYSGTCLPDIPFSALSDPLVDPFFYLSYKQYLSREQFQAIYETFESEVFQALDKSIQTSLQTVETDSGWLKSGSWSLFSEKGTTVKERLIVQDSESLNSVPTGTLADLDYKDLTRSQKLVAASVNSNKYDTLIEKYASMYKIPAGLLKAVIHQESGFNPNAKSGAGAEGLCQITADTAKYLGVKNRYDPEQSIAGGAKYLNILIKRYHGYELALAAYNAGMGNVDKYGGIPPFKETQNYVKNVMKLYRNLYSGALDAPPTVKKESSTGTSTTKLTQTAQTAMNNKASDDIQTQLKNGTMFRVKVKKIVDGDTYRVEYQGKSYEIRPSYFDAPETKHSASTPGDNYAIEYKTGENPGGDESTRFVSNLIKINSYIIISSPPGDSRYTDEHNRITTPVYLDGDYTSLAEEMIRSGYAFVWDKQTSGGSPILNNLLALQKEAKDRNIGVHGVVTVNEVMDLKNNLTKMTKELSSASNDQERIAIFKKYKDYLGSRYITVDGKQVDLGSPSEKKDKQQKTTEKLNDAVNRISNTNTSLKTVNYDIHVQGITSNSYQEAKRYMSAEWGSRAVYNRSKLVGYRMHYGIDISSSRAPSQYVIAAADGIVETRYMTGGGRVIIIDHGNGFYTRYMHLKEFLVKNHSKVKTGQVIAVIGNTNTIEGTSKNGEYHLHQETWVNINGGQGGGAKVVNVHPFRTTSLKLLSKLNPIEVLANTKKYISDPDLVLTSHLDKSSGKSVYGIDNTVQSIYTGKEVNKGVIDPAINQPITTDVSSTQESIGYTEPSSFKTADRGIADRYSVFYEENNRNAQATIATYHTGLGMKVNLPTFKMYIVIGSEIEDEKIGSSIKNSYYFEMDGVTDLSLFCNNDNNPVDVLSFKVANPSFINTDLIAIAGKYLTRDFTNVDTTAEVSFTANRLRIQAGTKIHFRAGYGNDPNELVTMFNGVITETSDPKGISLEIIAEGYGRELLLDSLNKASAETLSSADTPCVISTAIGNASSISNFGATASLAKAFLGTVAFTSNSLTGHSYTDPENKRLTTKGLDTNLYEPGNWRQRIFTNIYAAEVETVHDSYNTSWTNYLKKLFTSNSNEMYGYKYIFMGQSPWEVLKEMEYRHPGTMTKPLIYQDRMTIFFGYKDQMYIAKDLEPHFMSKTQSKDVDGINLDPEYIKERTLRFEPVCKFHLVTSEFNLLTNNIKLNNQFKTGVKVAYASFSSDKLKQTSTSMNEFEMQVDDDLMSFEKRVGTLDMPGIHGKYSAFMYGTTYLRRQLETMYSGTFTIIGNPHVKAGDFVHFKDSQKRLEGLIKVRECKHFFTENLGFRTEITPSLFVEPRSFMYSALMMKLSYAARVCLENAKLSNSIITNENVDFKTYQEYLDQLQLYIKRPTNWFDHIGFSEYTYLGNMWYDTGASGLFSASLVGVQFLSAAKLFLKTSITSTVASGAKTLLPAVRDWEALVFTYQYAKETVTKAQFLRLFASSRNFIQLSKLTAAANNAKNATAAAKGVMALRNGLSVVTATSWFAVTRGLGILSALFTGLLASNPAGWVVRIALGIMFMSFSNKVQQDELTRQPLSFYPMAYNGKPFVAGVTGYKYDSFYEAMKTNFSRNLKIFEKGLYAVHVSSNKEIARSLTGFVQNAGLSGYKSDVSESIAKSMTKMTPDQIADAKKKQLQSKTSN